MLSKLIYLTTKKLRNFTGLTRESLFLTHTTSAVCVKTLQGSSLQRSDSGIQAGSILACMVDAGEKKLEVVQGLFIASARQLHLQSIGQN